MVAGVSFPSILVTLEPQKNIPPSAIVVMKLGLSLILHAVACMQTEPKQRTRTGREGWGRERERERDQGTEGLEDKEQRGRLLHVSTITHSDMHARP